MGATTAGSRRTGSITTYSAVGIVEAVAASPRRVAVIGDSAVTQQRPARGQGVAGDRVKTPEDRRRPCGASGACIGAASWDRSQAPDIDGTRSGSGGEGKLQVRSRLRFAAHAKMCGAIDRCALRKGAQHGAAFAAEQPARDEAVLFANLALVLGKSCR